jgi:hypothetical protein
MTVQKSRHICFTLFDYPADGQLVWPEEKVRYAVWQEERGGETGRAHLQGYVEFVGPLSFKAVKDIIGRTAHLEIRRGTRDEARQYCRKEETRVAGPWEFGIWISGQGHRSDVDFIMDSLLAGKKERDILLENPKAWFKNHKGIPKAKCLLASNTRRSKPQVHVFLGDPGSGKSLAARHLAPEAFQRSPGAWWDGYDGEPDAIIDEIDKQELPLAQFLLVADASDAKLPVKGSFVPNGIKRLFVTSNREVHEWYPNLSSSELMSITRRFDTKMTFSWVHDGNTRRVVRRKEVYGVDLPEIPELPDLIERALAEHLVGTPQELPPTPQSPTTEATQGKTGVKRARVTRKR